MPGISIAPYVVQLRSYNTVPLLIKPSRIQSVRGDYAHYSAVCWGLLLLWQSAGAWDE